MVLLAQEEVKVKMEIKELMEYLDKMVQLVAMDKMVLMVLVDSRVRKD